MAKPLMWCLTLLLLATIGCRNNSEEFTEEFDWEMESEEPIEVTEVLIEGTTVAPARTQEAVAVEARPQANLTPLRDDAPSVVQESSFLLPPATNTPTVAPRLAGEWRIHGLGDRYLIVEGQDHSSIMISKTGFSRSVRFASGKLTFQEGEGVYSGTISGVFRTDSRLFTAPSTLRSLDANRVELETVFFEWNRTGVAKTIPVSLLLVRVEE
jgi:hypothetical protein